MREGSQIVWQNLWFVRVSPSSAPLLCTRLIVRTWQVLAWVDGWIDGGREGWMEGLMDGWMMDFQLNDYSFL